MSRRYSTRYTFTAKGRGSHGPEQKLTCGKWFWKLSGAVIVFATLFGLAGSFWFGWKIRSSLDALARETKTGRELQQISRLLKNEERNLFDKKRIETVAAAKLKLYPPSEKYLGAGITVRIPRP